MEERVLTWIYRGHIYQQRVIHFLGNHKREIYTPITLVFDQTFTRVITSLSENQIGEILCRLLQAARGDRTQPVRQLLRTLFQGPLAWTTTNRRTLRRIERQARRERNQQLMPGIRSPEQEEEQEPLNLESQRGRRRRGNYSFMPEGEIDILNEGYRAAINGQIRQESLAAEEEEIKARQRARPQEQTVVSEIQSQPSSIVESRNTHRILIQLIP